MSQNISISYKCGSFELSIYQIILEKKKIIMVSTKKHEAIFKKCFFLRGIAALE